MNHMRLAISISLCLLTGLFSCITLAETRAQAVAELEKLEAIKANKRDALETVRSRLDYYETKKPDAQTQLAEAQVTMAEAQSGLEEAEASKEADAERSIDLAKRRLELAVRGLQSREGRLERTIEKITELSAEEEQLDTELETVLKQIAEQKERIDILKEQESRPKVAASTPAPTPVPTPRPTAAPEPAPIKVEEEKAPEVAAAAKPAPTEAPRPAAAQDSVQLKDMSPQQRYAHVEMKKLNDLIKAANKKKRPRYDELMLDIDRNEEMELEFLGEEQYYGEFPLAAGAHKLTINLKQYKIHIPDEQDGATFVLIYDARNHRSPNLVFFNKALLKL